MNKTQLPTPTNLLSNPSGEQAGESHTELKWETLCPYNNQTLSAKKKIMHVTKYSAKTGKKKHNPKGRT